MRRLSEPCHIYVARGYFFFFILSLLTLAFECLNGLKIIALYWDLLEYLRKPDPISNTLCSSREIIPKFGLQMVILWEKIP